MVPISQQRKALLSAAVAFTSGAAAALADNGLTVGEGALVVSATVAAYALVYGVGNADADPPPPAEADAPL